MQIRRPTTPPTYVLRPRRTGALLGLTALALALAACASATSAPTQTSPVLVGGSVAVHAAGRCADGPRFSVRLDADTAVVGLPDRVLRLPRAPAASGARFARADTVLWEQAGEARVELGGDSWTGCTLEPASGPDEAMAGLGFIFRGVGQEPGWLIYVDPDRALRWIGDYGVVRTELPDPRRQDTEDGWVWQAEGDGRTLEVQVREEPCLDDMSGEPYPLTVEVRADGQGYRGCGGWVEEEG